MNFTERIKNLQDKPEAVRRKFAFTTALVLTAIIFFIWVVSFSASVRKETAQEAKTTPSPISVLASQIGSVFGQVKQGFAQVTGAIKGTKN